ncbi:hypothetical protein GGX14DRAFT_390639 [Mycena pura]|uniref:Uncharacterized protein n=1 Tax=Mycena pura TaxID=153505 RepID=A0AAD6VVE0_9AGAR|nr:hypothetical protein GGX14DRAFT_390639 [Mycena pura]
MVAVARAAEWSPMFAPSSLSLVSIDSGGHGFEGVVGLLWVAGGLGSLRRTRKDPDKVQRTIAETDGSVQRARARARRRGTARATSLRPGSRQQVSARQSGSDAHLPGAAGRGSGGRVGDVTKICEPSAGIGRQQWDVPTCRGHGHRAKRAGGMQTAQSARSAGRGLGTSQSAWLRPGSCQDSAGRHRGNAPSKKARTERGREACRGRGTLRAAQVSKNTRTEGEPAASELRGSGSSSSSISSRVCRVPATGRRSSLRASTFGEVGGEAGWGVSRWWWEESKKRSSESYWQCDVVSACPALSAWQKKQHWQQAQGRNDGRSILICIQVASGQGSPQMCIVDGECYDNTEMEAVTKQ